MSHTPQLGFYFSYQLRSAHLLVERLCALSDRAYLFSSFSAFFSIEDAWPDERTNELRSALAGRSPCSSDEFEGLAPPPRSPATRYFCSSERCKSKLKKAAT